MKLTLKKSLLLNMSSVILGLGLSVAALNVSAAPEEEAKAATEMSEKINEVVAEGMNKSEATSEAVTEGKTEAPKASGVTSATPPLHDFKFSGVHSLRDGVALDGGNAAADIKLLPADSLPIARNYFQQPPMIPHRVREYKITVRNNKCMSCHSWNNYKKARATKVSQTHFADRDGNAQSTLAARRYFCNQCHVPQVDAKPLVGNDFKPVSELDK